MLGAEKVDGRELNVEETLNTGVLQEELDALRLFMLGFSG